jgi:hypothetical protein
MRWELNPDGRIRSFTSYHFSGGAPCAGGFFIQGFSEMRSIFVFFGVVTGLVFRSTSLIIGDGYYSLAVDLLGSTISSPSTITSSISTSFV